MKIGISGNPAKAGLGEALEQTVRVARLAGHVVSVQRELRSFLQLSAKQLANAAISYKDEQTILAASDIAIVLGGDGSILRAARMVGGAGTPILGVNLGKLGFLTELSREDIETDLAPILKGGYRIEERTMLAAVVGQRRTHLNCMNDIVVEKAGWLRAVNIEILIDGKPLATYTSDGVIVSTPTGSTAYSLSAGGPILIPETSALVITPISPHALTARSVVVPDGSQIQIRVSERIPSINVTADGQDCKRFKPPIVVDISKAEYRARLLKRQTSDYFSLLRQKMQLGVDVRRHED